MTNTMYRYYTLNANGLQGGNYYKTEEEAQAAADRRNAITGRKWWTVREVWLRDPYADDTRPYKTMKRA